MSKHWAFGVGIASLAGAFGYAVCSGVNHERGARAGASIPEAQAVVTSILGPDYVVVGSTPDGPLALLSINYAGYRIDNIYLREDGIRLFRAEEVISQTEDESRTLALAASGRTAYRNSINAALAKDGEHEQPTSTAKPPEQLHYAPSPVAPAPQGGEALSRAKSIEPPTLPRKADVADIDSIYRELATRRYVRSSEGSRILYVFDDYLCPACREASNFLNAQAAQRGIEVRHIPVSVIGPKSLALAAYVMTPEDMADRVKRGEDARDNPKEILEKIDSKSIKIPESRVSDALVNFSLFMKLKSGTPTFVYQTKQGAMASTATSAESLSDILDSISVAP